jgi:hypothetical protein
MGAYDRKGHENFKLEWEMYLKPGTTFDKIVQQLFAEGWHVLAIMEKNRNTVLKRLETKKQNSVDGLRPDGSSARVLITRAPKRAVAATISVPGKAAARAEVATVSMTDWDVFELARRMRMAPARRKSCDGL